MDVYVSKQAKVKVTYKKYFFRKYIVLESGARYQTKRNRRNSIQIDRILFNENTDKCKILTTSYFSGVQSVFHNFLTVTEFLTIIGILPGSYTLEIIEEDKLHIHDIIFEGLDDISMYTENKDMVLYKIKDVDESIIKEGIGLIRGVRKEENGTMSCVISDIQNNFNENEKITKYDDIRNCSIDMTPIRRLVH